MKKLITIFFAALLFVSCGPSKTAIEARKTLNGAWTLSEITYPNRGGTYNVTLFNDASADCFRGSQWGFVSNNNTGTYTLKGENCTTGLRYFRWSIDESTGGIFDLLLKPTDERYRSTTGDQGFRLKLVSLTGDSMTWEQTVRLEGNPFLIRMIFTKS